MSRIRSFIDAYVARQSLVLLIAVFTLGVVAGNLTQTPTIALSDTEEAFESFWDAFDIIEARYVDKVEIDRLVNGAIDGMVRALDDDHSGYIRPDLFRNSTNFSGEFSGIGVIIEVNEATDDIEVVTVIPGSPAESVGVEPGDVFYEVDGARVTDYSQAELSAIVPGPRGTTVTVTFKRGDELVTFDIVRDTFPLPNVTWELVGEGIAHITMKDFNDLSRSQLDEALNAVDISTTKGLVFDIRDNPGGTLASAIEIGSAFIEDGVLLRQVARDETEEVTRTRGGYAEIKAPIVVLVDETSASASEVITGAMQDYGVATIMGETTFGKGTVQNIPQLANGGGLRITVRRWLTPDGHWIHDQGITPDIIVDWDPESEAEREDDIQLQAAVNYLLGLRDN